MREREREHVWACVRERERERVRACVRAFVRATYRHKPNPPAASLHTIICSHTYPKTLLTVLEASGCRFQFVGVRHHVVDYGGWHQALDYGRRHVMAYRGKRTDFIFGVSHHVLALPLQVYPTHDAV